MPKVKQRPADESRMAVLHKSLEFLRDRVKMKLRINSEMIQEDLSEINQRNVL